GGISDVNVVMPFNEEYQIKFKNTSRTRRRLEIDIDGTEVSKDLILGGNGEFKLERFLNSDKKFKFVSVNNAAVSDPTSKENGVIRIRVYDELSRTAWKVLGEIMERKREVEQRTWPTHP